MAVVLTGCCLGEPLVAGEMLLLSNSCNFWAKLLDNFTAWVVRGGSEWRGGGGGKHLGFIAQRLLCLLWRPIRSVLGHSDTHLPFFGVSGPDMIANCLTNPVFFKGNLLRFCWWAVVIVGCFLNLFLWCWTRPWGWMSAYIPALSCTQGSLGSGNPILCFPSRRKIRWCRIYKGDRNILSLGLTGVKLACSSHFERIWASM